MSDTCKVCKKDFSREGSYGISLCEGCFARLDALKVCMECQGTGFSGNDPDYPCPYCDAGVVAKRANEIYEQRLEEARQEFKELLDESLSEAIEYRKSIEAERDVLCAPLEKMYEIPTDEWDKPLPLEEPCQTELCPALGNTDCEKRCDLWRTWAKITGNCCDCEQECHVACEGDVAHRYCEACFQALCGEMYIAGKDKETAMRMRKAAEIQDQISDAEKQVATGTSRWQGMSYEEGVAEVMAGSEGLARAHAMFELMMSDYYEGKFNPKTLLDFCQGILDWTKVTKWK